MKRALIIGAGGFVGSYLIKELSENGYETFACDCKDNVVGIKNYSKLDITNPDAVYAVLSEIKPTVIFNLAAISSVGQSWNIPQITMQINVCGTINILEAVRKTDAKTKVILIGSSEEYSPSNNPVSEQDKLEAVNPYGISRITIENFAHLYRNRYNLDIICVRAFNHTGIGQTSTFVLPSFITQVAKLSKEKKDGEISVGNISVYRDFSDVRDIVKAYRLIAECKESITVINVGSGVAYKIEEMLDYIISLSPQNIKVVIDKNKFRPADLPYCCCDNTLLKSKTGWVAEYCIFDTLKKMYEFELSNN